MSYPIPSEFVTKLLDTAIFMPTRDTLTSAYMAAAILTLTAVFAVAITVRTGSPILAAILFSVSLVKTCQNLSSTRAIPTKRF